MRLFNVKSFQSVVESPEVVIVLLPLAPAKSWLLLYEFLDALFGLVPPLFEGGHLLSDFNHGRIKHSFIRLKTTTIIYSNSFNYISK